MPANQAVTYMAVVKVAGDGNCLFHALAMHEGVDSAALKIEIIDYMDNILAEADEAMREVWQEEAKHLRGNAQENWAGHMAMVAYSAMREKRVTLHERQPDGKCKAGRVCDIDLFFKSIY